jgi:bacterial/archaeal transporter family-2 protein
MNYSSLLALSVTVGIMVVIQGGINARLGVLLQNSLLATTIALGIGALLTLFAVIITVRHFPSNQQLQKIPWYMWFTGGVLSFLAVSLFYYLIPKVGIGTAVVFGLTGQLVFSAVAAHFGWFSLPVEPLTGKRIAGLLVMIGGLVIIKS